MLRTSTRLGMPAIALFLGIAMSAAYGGERSDSDQQQSTNRPEGVYSAEQLLEADVYARASGEEIGEIEDIIFSNNMSIKSFVVQTKSSAGLAGKSYVVSPDQISVEAKQGDKATEPEYRITFDASSEELRHNPVYSDSWWNRAQQQASQAWQQTKKTASSAWTTIKAGTASLVDKVKNATDEAADNTADMADSAGNAASDAVNETQQTADQAADKTGDAANQAKKSAEDVAD